MKARLSTSSFNRLLINPISVKPSNGYRTSSIIIDSDYALMISSNKLILCLNERIICICFNIKDTSKQMINQLYYSSLILPDCSQANFQQTPLQVIRLLIIYINFITNNSKSLLYLTIIVKYIFSN